MNSVLTSNPEIKAKSLKQANAVIVFNLKNKAGKTASWTLDAKKEGKVARGAATTFDVSLTVSDDHFGQLVDGKANPQKLFMSGKLKVKGNIMKASALEGVLKATRSEVKL
jgi:putative sterol carrier protein